MLTFFADDHFLGVIAMDFGILGFHGTFMRFFLFFQFYFQKDQFLGFVKMRIFPLNLRIFGCYGLDSIENLRYSF